MAADEIHVGDTGTRITLTVYDGDSVVDLGSFTTIQIIFEDPDGASNAMTATLTTDGSDGKMYVDTEETTFDQSGEWGMQGYVEVAGGEPPVITSCWHTDLTRFTVYPNID